MKGTENKDTAQVIFGAGITCEDELRDTGDVLMTTCSNGILICHYYSLPFSIWMAGYLKINQTIYKIDIRKRDDEDDK